MKKIQGTSKERGFLFGNLKDHIINTSFRITTRILDLRPEVEDQYRETVELLISCSF